MLKKNIKMSSEEFNKIADEVRKELHSNDTDIDFGIKLVIELTIACFKKNICENEKES